MILMLQMKKQILKKSNYLLPGDIASEAVDLTTEFYHPETKIYDQHCCLFNQNHVAIILNVWF